MRLLFRCRFDLGVGFRIRYGDLLKGFRNLPVWRTTSQGKSIVSYKLLLCAESPWILRANA
jgi:hypothetical protein